MQKQGCHYRPNGQEKKNFVEQPFPTSILIPDAKAIEALRNSSPKGENMPGKSIVQIIGPLSSIVIMYDKRDRRGMCIMEKISTTTWPREQGLKCNDSRF